MGATPLYSSTGAGLPPAGHPIYASFPFRGGLLLSQIAEGVPAVTVSLQYRGTAVHAENLVPHTLYQA